MSWLSAITTTHPRLGLLDLLWESLADVLGTAATATLLRRAIKAAAPRTSWSESVTVTRKGLDYEYRLPETWMQPGNEEALSALRIVAAELRALLVELTGPVVVRRLARWLPSGARDRLQRGGADMTNDAVTLERLGTGSASLDAILGGGIPAGSVTVVAGEPGSGKTVFTLQALFHHARQGKKCLYFTTLSEPAMKIIRYMQLFSFFDARLIEERIVFVDLGSTLRHSGLEQTLAQMIQRVESEEPDLVAVDSFKAIHDLLLSRRAGRAFVYDLSVSMAAWGATTLLVGEYTPEDIGVAPEFAIADGIVRLTTERQELTTIRQLEVLKLRGANYVTGRHFFEIGPDGFTFYPRVRGPEMTDEPTGRSRGPGRYRRRRARRRSCAVACRARARRSSRAAPARARRSWACTSSSRGAPWGARDPLHAGGDAGADPGGREELRLGPRPPGGSGPAPSSAIPRRSSSSPTASLTWRGGRSGGLGARRAVLDSLTSMSLGVSSPRRFRELVYALTKHFRVAGVTSLMTMEVAELLGTAQLTGHGLSSIADNLILLRYVEVVGRLERAVSVLKARGVGHSSELRRFRIDAHGAHVGERFEDLRGVLTGVPQPVRATGHSGGRRSSGTKHREG